MDRDHLTLHKRDGREVTVPLGKDHRLDREYDDGNLDDVQLVAQIDPEHEISTLILLRSDGGWDWWRTEFRDRAHYWHTRPGTTEPDPTDAQIEAIEQWQRDPEARPFGVKPSRPLLIWAGLIEDVAQEDHVRDHGGDA